MKEENEEEQQLRSRAVLLEESMLEVGSRAISPWALGPRTLGIMSDFLGGNHFRF